MRSHESLAKIASQKILETLGLTDIDEQTATELRRLLTYFLNWETSIAQEIIRNAEPKKIRESLFSRLKTELLSQCPDGLRRESNTATRNWMEWFPGLENNELTLKTVLATMPAAPPESIPAIVKFFENPESPIAFRGAITLERHDIMHVLLGRGLLDQDEAFVIGYTMGTVKTLTGVERWLFKKVISSYPEPYRVFGDDLSAFDLGIEAGKKCLTENIADRPLEDLRELSLGEVRAKLGIDTFDLKRVYALEKQRLPHTVSSARLSVGQEPDR